MVKSRVLLPVFLGLPLVLLGLVPLDGAAEAPIGSVLWSQDGGLVLELLRTSTLSSAGASRSEIPEKTILVLSRVEGGERRTVWVGPFEMRLMGLPASVTQAVVVGTAGIDLTVVYCRKKQSTLHGIAWKVDAGVEGEYPPDVSDADFVAQVSKVKPFVNKVWKAQDTGHMDLHSIQASSIPSGCVCCLKLGGSREKSALVLLLQPGVVKRLIWDPMVK